MDYMIVFIFLNVLNTACCMNEYVHNMSRLISKYLEYCGSESICSKMDEKGNLQISKTSNFHDCLSCSCSEYCDFNRNCCLDESYSTCVQSMIPWSIFNQDQSYKMVSSCPDLYEICLQPITGTNFLHQIPVYSFVTNKTYANVNCSKCHGENETVSWAYYIECPYKEIDIDDYTDAPSLWNGMMYSSCALKLTPPVNTFQRHCEVTSLVSTCNITGDWDVYDKEIQDACKHYQKPYKFYQNVFCFLCNTGKEQRKVLKRTESNKTPMSFEREYNIPSYLMNYNKSHEQMLQFDDALVLFSEEYNGTNDRYIANLTLLSLNLAESLNKSLSGNYTLNESVDFEAAVNLTALYEEYVRSGGYRNWCSEEHRVDKIFPGFKARRDCSCDDNCYKSASCCPDAAFFQRRTCSAAHIIRTARYEFNTSYYFMIRKCPIYYKHASIKLKCESNSNVDLLNIPVINIQTHETYFNIYCYICHNQKEPNYQNLTDIMVWNVSLVCPKLFFPALKPSISAILQTANENGCSLHYSTTFFVDSCELTDRQTIGICNQTGVVKSVSQSARFMCESIDGNLMAKSQYSMYKNPICDLCNSEIFEEPISNCYFKDLDVSNLDRYNCENGNLDVHSYPFKNRYCKTCNRRIMLPQTGTDFIHNDIFKNGLPTYRNLFVMSDTSEEDPTRQVVGCSRSQFKDTYTSKCRKLLCSRGKLLMNNTCSYFVPYAREAQYNVALRVLRHSNSTHTNLRNIIDNLQEILQKEIKEGNINIEDIYVYSKLSCNEPMGLSTDICLIYIRIKVQNNQFPINRNRLEMQLLGLTNIRIKFEGVLLEFQQSLEAWFLPIYNHEKKINSVECFTKKTSPSSKYSYNINNLLVCKQIKLEPDEYVLSKDHSSMYVKSVDNRYNLNEFVKESNGRVRICAESYKRKRKVYFSSDQKGNLDIGLMVVTYICTIFSLLCLLATILIYCILPVLRTVPGKNTMCYAFSLFLAQLFFIIQAYITNEKACAWIGGFTHYFWITVFTCTNICCFHMFRLFVRNALTHGDVSAERKLFIKYCLASFLLPLLPVALNISLAYTNIKSIQFGYGGKKCFLLDHKAQILLFIIPIFLQIIFNIIMFSITFHYIRNTPKVKSTQDRHDFTIFMKLFLLTGVSWLFMIVDGFFDVSPFTFLATIVNGAQGVIIFVSYICNKRVFKLLKDKHDQLQSTRSQNIHSSTANHTTTTQM
ncbi:uncharacterized protein [Magallana gigas]|uniref:uncharacterized protein n=1 Tax=Magallana gigas TaxID=29159 RepID=UPI00333EB389